MKTFLNWAFALLLCVIAFACSQEEGLTPTDDASVQFSAQKVALAATPPVNVAPAVWEEVVFNKDTTLFRPAIGHLILLPSGLYQVVSSGRMIDLKTDTLAKKPGSWSQAIKAKARWFRPTGNQPAAALKLVAGWLDFPEEGTLLQLEVDSVRTGIPTSVEVDRTDTRNPDNRSRVLIGTPHTAAEQNYAYNRDGKGLTGLTTPSRTYNWKDRKGTTASGEFYWLVQRSTEDVK